jgi:hypothetical protein
MFNDGDVITKVWMLLDIIHKATSAGPAYQKWSLHAQDELARIEDTFDPPGEGDEREPPEGSTDV